jgi:hypothetical protein
MRTYNSLQEIALDLKKSDLKRQIAREELILNYNSLGNSLAKGFLTSAAFTLAKSLVTRFIIKRFF